MNIKEYALKVQEMRNAQKNYFKVARSGANAAGKYDALDLSRKLEREVDALTAHAIDLDNAKQSSLFNSER